MVFAASIRPVLLPHSLMLNAMARIVVTGKLPEKPVVVEGFPSKGFVSTIAANYMIREMGMKLVGYMDSRETSNVTVIRESTPLRPIRIYTKDNIIMIYSEVMVPFNTIPDIAGAINAWLEKLNPSLVILMAGIMGVEPGKGHEILGVTSKQGLSRLLEGSKVRLIKEGVLTGVSSNILLHCVEKDIPAVALMVETEYSPDAVAAASMIEVLNRLLKVEINSETLLKMGKDIESQFKRIISQMKKGREGYIRMEEGPMYG